MINLTKENLLEFLEHYHYFHDSTISNVEYDVNKSEINLLIDVCWSGEQKLKDDKHYETNPKKLKIVFEQIEEFNNKGIFSWSFIYNVYVKFFILNDKEFICFANEEKEPFLCIVAENAKYEEID